MSLRDFGLLTLVCLVWASNNIVSKYVVSHLGLPPLFYAAVRFAIVAAASAPWLLPMPKPRWRLIVVALLMGGGNFALLFVGLKTSTPSAAAVIGQLGVPMTTLLSVVMLGERIRWRRGLGIALTFAGAIVPAAYTSFRADTLIDDCGKYYFTVVRWDAAGLDLPLWIPEGIVSTDPVNALPQGFPNGGARQPPSGTTPAAQLVTAFASDVQARCVAMTSVVQLKAQTRSSP